MNPSDGPDMRDIDTFCKDFYQSLGKRDLDPNDPLYVPLFEDRQLFSTDPVEALLRGIEWGGTASVQLLSGFRGTGKTTALRRLERDLVERGYLVVRCDMEDYLNMSAPVDVSDFLVSMAGAFGEKLGRDDLLGRDPSVPTYWERFATFWTRERGASADEWMLGAKGAGVKLSLKTDPTFKERLRSAMEGRLGALLEDVRAYMADAVKALRKRHGDDAQVVLMLDSVEHLRGTSSNARDVESSLENLFGQHADKLRFQSLHVVVTVPPWLKIRLPGLEGSFDGGELLPCLKVRGHDGERVPEALDALARVLARRGDWRRLFGNRDALDRVLLASGGYLRDLFRMVRSALILASQRGALPLDAAMVDLAVSELRNDYLPIARSDARWLVEVAETHDAGLDSPDQLATLSRFFDTHLVLCYRNGREWYDVHPLVAEHVARLAGADPRRIAREPGADEE